MKMFDLANNEDLSLNRLDNLVNILNFRATHEPEREAFTFLSDGTFPTTVINYHDLATSSKALASRLQKIVPMGERALLLYTPGPEYIKALFGCLYAGVIAVPVYVSNRSKLDNSLTQLIKIAEDAQLKLILTTASNQELIETLFEAFPTLSRAECVFTDNITNDSILDLSLDSLPSITSKEIALLQYTSGSTNTPKGVVLTHDNLITNIKAIHHYFSMKSSSRGVIWLPPYHDMGLIGGILTPIMSGFPVTLMSPVSFIQDPLFWLKTITSFKGTISGGPNFAYDFCVKRMKKRPYNNLDLSSWDVAFCGAEPINPKTINDFIETFSPYGLRREAFQSCYGLAESTLMVTTSLTSKNKSSLTHCFLSSDCKYYEPATTENLEKTLRLNNIAEDTTDEENKNLHLLVSCGSVIKDHELKIVDPTTQQEVYSQTVGEIWARGASVSDRYWNKQLETNETFNGQLKSDDFQATKNSSARWLRTGDLGFLHNNELFVTGRIKELIIIHGRNYYPHDIEFTTKNAHPMLENYPSAVFSVLNQSGESVIIVQELPKSQQNKNLEEIISAIIQRVFEKHEALISEIILVKAGTIPKTSSGKIKRLACKESYLNGKLEILISEKNDAINSVESPSKVTSPESFNFDFEDDKLSSLINYLITKLKHLFGLKSIIITEKSRLTDLGIDSIGLVELKHQLDQELNIELNVTFFLNNPNLYEIAHHIKILKQKGVTGLAIRQQQDVEQLPLTHAQRASWFLHQVKPLSSAQTIARALQISGPLNTCALVRALETLILKHPALRSTFSSITGDPIQIFHDTLLPGTIQVFEDRFLNEQTLEQKLHQEAYRPFDLVNGPLIRFTIFVCPQNKATLLFSAHHIILDFWSFSLLFDDLFKLYTFFSNKTNTAHAITDEDTSSKTLSADLISSIHPSVHFEWYSSYFNSSKSEEDWQYWQKILTAPIPQLSFKTNTNSIQSSKFSAKRYHFEVDSDLSEKIISFSKKNQLTPYIIFFSVFHILLHRLSNQKEIMIGTPVAIRNWPGADRMVGYCVNVLPIRSHFSEDPSFVTLVNSLKSNITLSLDRQNFPFSLMVERLKLNRKTDYRPILNVVFMYQQTNSALFKDLAMIAVNRENVQIPFDNLTLETLPLNPENLQFELTLSVAPAKDGFVCSFDYETQFFEANYIKILSLEYLHLLEEALSKEQKTISQLSLTNEKTLANVFQTNECAAISSSNTSELYESRIYVPPRTPLESELIRLWEELSNQRNISVHDNFFDLGGSSLLSVKLANQISAQLKIHIDVTKIFEFQTVADLAKFIETSNPVDLKPEPIKKIPRVPYLPKSAIV